MDDLELDDDNYKAPADLMKDKEALKSDEQDVSAADLIQRCKEYAHKYENEDEEDKEVILEESSDESEVWDCETIVSTYSNLDNHPGKIGAPEATRKKKLAQTVSAAWSSSTHKISLKGKEKIPLDFLAGIRTPAVEKEKDLNTLKTDQHKNKQIGHESYSTHG